MKTIFLPLPNGSFFTLLLLFLLKSSLSAQDSTIQLPKEIAEEINDSLRMEQIMGLILQQKNKSPKKQIAYSKVALSIAINNNYHNRRFHILTNLGLAHIALGQYANAAQVFLQNFEQIKQHNLIVPQEILAKNYNSIGTSYQNMKDYTNSLKYHFEALAIREQINSPKLSSSYNNLGIVYMETKQYDKAIEYFEQSLALKQKNKDTKGIANTLNNIGIIYKRIRHYEKADDYYQRSYLLSKELNDSEKMANVLANKAQISFWKDEYQQAISYYKEALVLRQKGTNILLVAETLLYIAQMYIKAHNPEQAFRYLERADVIIEQEDLSLKFFQAYELRSNYYTLIDDSKQASFYYQKYKKISDSLALKKNAKILADIEAKYETEKKEREIELLKQKSKIDQLELLTIQKERKWMIALSTLLLFILGILFWLYRYRMKTNQELSALNATKDKLFTIIGHDLKNPVIGFRSITQSLSTNLDNMDKPSILYFIQKLEKSSNQLYLLIQNLLQWAINQSGQLNNVPQTFALEQLVTDVFNLFKINAEREEVQLINDIPVDHLVHASPKMVQTILRNLVDNAIKFTPKGGKVFIKTKQQGKRITVSVIDTGRGMSKEEQSDLFKATPSTSNTAIPEKGTGIGLLLCKELAAQQGSNIQVSSQVNKGTTFSFSLQQPTNA